MATKAPSQIVKNNKLHLNHKYNWIGVFVFWILILIRKNTFLFEGIILIQILI